MFNEKYLEKLLKRKASTMKKKITYKDAGVDIAKADDVISLSKNKKIILKIPHILIYPMEKQDKNHLVFAHHKLIVQDNLHHVVQIM